MSRHPAKPWRANLARLSPYVLLMLLPACGQTTDVAASVQTFTLDFLRAALAAFLL